MPTRNVSLTDHQDALIGEALASGRYQNASEVVREALRLLETRDREDAEKLARLRRAIAEGEEDIANGNYIDLEEAELDSWLSSLGQKQSA